MSQSRTSQAEENIAAMIEIAKETNMLVKFLVRKAGDDPEEILARADAARPRRQSPGGA